MFQLTYRNSFIDVEERVPNSLGGMREESLNLLILSTLSWCLVLVVWVLIPCSRSMAKGSSVRSPWTNLHTATCAEQLAQSHWRRATCTKLCVELACAQLLTHSNLGQLHRLICTEQTCADFRRAICEELLARSHLRRGE